MPKTEIQIDREVLYSLAMMKMRGWTWSSISEKTKLPVDALEYLPWSESKEWARACRYAQKLVTHETLAETLADLRLQMNDPQLPARLKTQISNSIVRVIQLQHALHQAKKPTQAAKRTLPPIAVPTHENRPRETSAPPINVGPPVQPPPAQQTPLKTTVAALLFVLLGCFGVLQRFSQTTETTSTAAMTVADRVATVEPSLHNEDTTSGVVDIAHDKQRTARWAKFVANMAGGSPRTIPTGETGRATRMLARPAWRIPQPEVVVVNPSSS